MSTSIPNPTPTPPPPLNQFDRLELDHLEIIRDNLCQSALNALSQTCKQYHTSLTPFLYHHIRITSKDALFRLIGVMFTPRAVYSHTRRITLDCPCTAELRWRLKEWNETPKKGLGYRIPGPLFEKVESVVFALTWMESLKDADKMIAFRTTEGLLRLANPQAICFDYPPTVSFFSGYVGYLVYLMDYRWYQLTSVSCHRRVTPDHDISWHEPIIRHPRTAGRISFMFYDEKHGVPCDACDGQS